MEILCFEINKKLSKKRKDYLASNFFNTNEVKQLMQLTEEMVKNHGHSDIDGLIKDYIELRRNNGK